MEDRHPKRNNSQLVRERAEAGVLTLPKSEEQFRLLVESVRDYAIFMLDPEGRVLSWNPGAERIKGYPVEEVLGRHFSLFYPPEDIEQGKPEAELRAAATEGQTEDEGWRVRKDGTRFWANAVLTAIYADGQLRGFAKVTRDLTERKQATDRLNAYAAMLEQSNRELQDFALIASHDLQEPLRKIQAFGDLLREECAPALQGDGLLYLQEMQQSAGRMQNLIQALLALSRVTTRGQPFVPVNLGQVTEEVLIDLAIRVEQTGARVEVEALPTLEADPTQMRQLMQNVIGNALKFHREEVPPVIRVSSRLANGAEFRPEGSAGPAPCWEIIVQDNGIGFDCKYLDRIFAPFQRLQSRSRYEGTGIGLAICRRIVERHGGTITATSTPAHGSTFTMAFPVHQEVNRQ